MKLKEAAKFKEHDLLTDPVEIDGWLDLNGVGTHYELTQKDGVNMVSRSTVDFRNAHISKLRVQFGNVDNFYLEGNPGLESLKGSPITCRKMIIKTCKKLKSLKYCGSVAEDFDCSDCAIESLEGGPTNTGIRYYNCGNNPLTSFVGAPTELQYFFADSTKITSLEGVPRISQKLAFRMCAELTSLKNIHKQIDSTEFIDISKTPIKSAILGLIMIDGLKTVLYQTDDMRLDAALSIVTRYLRKGRHGVLQAQDELIEADLEEFAEL